MLPSRSSRGGGSEALVLEHVSRRYGDHVALAPVTLTVGTGAVGVVVGDNGAGKTTLLRIAAGLLRPSSGTRACAGRAVYLRPGSGARAAQRVRDAVAFAAAVSGTGVRVDEVLERADLRSVAERRTGTLSAGQRSRLCIALALATSPLVVCLDEPTASLDTDGRERTRAAIGELAATGSAVLVATHDEVLIEAGGDALVRLRSGVVQA